LLRQFEAWFQQMLQLIRLLGRQVLSPLIRRFPPIIDDALEELGKRSLARTLWGERWLANAFTTPGPEEGIELTAWAVAESGVGLLTIGAAITLGVLAVYTWVNVVAPVWLAFRNESPNAAVMMNAQRELLTRGGAYAGMPVDLLNLWRPNPTIKAINAGNTERQNAIVDLNVAPAGSAGTGARDVDDSTIEDFRSLIDKRPPPKSRALSSSDAPKQSATFDEASLQRERMNASISGDMDRYNQLIEQHRTLYKARGVDPCRSGFFPEGCR